MLVKSVREYEDILFYKKYKDQAEKQQIQSILSDLKRQHQRLESRPTSTQAF